MPSFAYLYDMNQTVYNISSEHGIREGIVKKIDVTMTYGITTINYYIAFSKATQGSAVVQESTLFPTPDSAWQAYKLQMLGQTQ